MKKTGILLYNEDNEIFLLDNWRLPIYENEISDLDSALHSFEILTGLKLNQENFEFINLGEFNNTTIYATEFNLEINLEINYNWFDIERIKKNMTEDIEFINRIEKYFLEDNDKEIDDFDESKSRNPLEPVSFDNMSVQEKRDFYHKYLNSLENDKFNDDLSNNIFEKMGVNSDVLEWSEFIYNIIENEIFLFSIDVEETPDEFIYQMENKNTYSTSTLFDEFQMEELLENESENIKEFITDFALEIIITFIDIKKDFNFDVELSTAYFDETNRKLVFDIYLPDSYISEKSKNEETYKKYINNYFGDFLKSNVSHEATHILEFIEKSKNPNNEHGIDVLRNFLNNHLSNKSMSKFSNEWRHFLKLVYLNIPFEVNARITQLFVQIQNKNIDTQSDFWNEVKKTTVWNEMIDLKNFNSDEFYENIEFHLPKDFDDENIINIFNEYKDDKEKLKSVMIYGLLSTWNKTIDLINDEYKDKDVQLKPIGIDFYDEPIKFFNSYEKKFHRTWDDFYKRVSKLYTNF